MSTEKKSTSKKSTKATDEKPKNKKKVEAEVVSEKTSTTDQIDSKTLIILSHILGIVTSFVAPLVIYLIAKDSLVKKHAAASLNFQISLIIYGTVITVVGFILTFITLGLFGFILFPLYLVFIGYALVLPIIATLKASDNIKDIYAYPLTLQLVK
jgi:hypothetical protein